MQAIFDLALGLDVRSAGDAVIARAGMLGVDQKRESPALGKLKRVANSENRSSILGPIDAVAGEIPAIGGLAHALQDLFEIELVLGPWRCAAIAPALTEIVDAGSALRAHRRHAAELG